MRVIVVLLLTFAFVSLPVRAGQIVAGSLEDKSCQRIKMEAIADARLQLLLDFEKGFPHSKALPDVYARIIDLYRQKGDRLKVIEYGEKTLKMDDQNLMAMMVLARNYAIEGKELDRAVMLAKQPVDRIENAKTDPMQIGRDWTWLDFAGF